MGTLYLSWRGSGSFEYKKKRKAKDGSVASFQSPLKIGQMIRKSPSAGGSISKRPSTDGIVMSPKDAKGTTMMGPETPPPPPVQCKDKLKNYEVLS